MPVDFSAYSFSLGSKYVQLFIYSLKLKIERIIVLFHMSQGPMKTEKNMLTSTTRGIAKFTNEPYLVSFVVL